VLPLSPTTGYCGFFIDCIFAPVVHVVTAVVKAIDSVPVLGTVLSAAIAMAACGPGAPACIAATTVRQWPEYPKVQDNDEERRGKNRSDRHVESLLPGNVS
jgi:hypothetical protein